MGRQGMTLPPFSVILPGTTTRGRLGMARFQVRYAAAAIALAAFFGGTGTAEAACQCSCVNGQVRPVCTSSIDIRPICTPGICPIVPPAIKPIAPPAIPPLGTKSCRMVQVLNPATGLYEWRNLCR